MKSESPIRVLHVLATMNTGGTETMIMNLFRHIDRTRVQFDFAVCTENKCDYEDEIIKLGGKLIRYPRYKGINHFSYTKWWSNFFKEHNEYRIVHGHIGSTASIYLKIAKRYGIFTIAHSHNLFGPITLHSILYRLFSYRTRYIADHFFGCSQAALKSRYGYKVSNDHSKSFVLNNAIDVSSFVYDEYVRNDVRKELNISSSDFVIGTVGRLAIQKNPFIILEILFKLKKSISNFIFIWIGTGELEEKIIQKIKEYNLQKNVMMLGLREDVNRLLQAMDIFLFPSLYEGLGMAAIEAQTAGLPTLCSSCGSHEVQVTDLCKLLPLENVNMWCDEIMKIRSKLYSGTYRRRNIYEQVKNAHYDVKETGKWLQNFYLHIMKSV